MVSRKEITGAELALVQTYLKKGALVPRHAHGAEQLIYVLHGALRRTSAISASPSAKVTSFRCRPGSNTRPRRSMTRSSSTSGGRVTRDPILTVVMGVRNVAPYVRAAIRFGAGADPR